MLQNVWHEFVQRIAARKMMQEVLEKLPPAEKDVDRVEEATQMRTSKEGASKELMLQAQQAVAKAGEHVNTVVGFIESKKKNAAGLAKEELQKMEYRARQSVQRLVDLKTFQKEAVLVKEAVEKFQMVQETVAKAADAEGPFLMAEEAPKAKAPNHGNVMTTSDKQFHEELFGVVSQEQRDDGSPWWSWCCCLARQKWAEANDAFTADATCTSLSNLQMLI